MQDPLEKEITYSGEAEYAFSPLPGSVRKQPLAPAMVVSRVGFSAPVDDKMDRPLDLNTLLIEHPSATYFVRMRGERMAEAGIHDGDLLVVDRAVEPHDGHIVIVAVDGVLAVRRLAMHNGGMRLLSRPTVGKTSDTNEDALLWGVCRHVIHCLGRS